MQISISTANLYFKPFDEAIRLIAEAGYQAVELDLYWSRKHLAMAQHLKDVSAKQIVRTIEQAGLRISSIHDGGGILEEKQTCNGYLNPFLNEVLEEISYKPDCIIFHTPQIEGNHDPDWEKRILERIIGPLEKYRSACRFVTVENLPNFDGYFVPLIKPEALRAFAVKNDLYVTLDTTHYAQESIDIIEAAALLNDRIKTTHLSDYREGISHVYPGEGELDLNGYLNKLGQFTLDAITLETSFSTLSKSDQGMSKEELVHRLIEARLWIENRLIKN